MTTRTRKPAAPARPQARGTPPVTPSILRRQLTSYLRGLDLQEQQGHPRVDRAAKIIYGVRVCGLVSDNGRKYLTEALARARRLYEGMKVRISHRKGNGDRTILETFGWLRDVAPDSNGILRGNLHYLENHALAAVVCEAAERNPNLWGLSHDIDADTRQEPDGTLTITEITKVHSVDLVDEPATGTGLFESKLMTTKVKLTLRKLLTEAKGLPGATRKALLEMGAACGQTMDREYEADMPGEPVASETAPEEKDWKQHLVDAIGKLCQDDSPECHEIAKKIMALLKPVEAEEPEEEEEEEEPDGEEDKEKDKKEARRLKAELHTIQEAAKIRDALDDAGLSFASSKARNSFIKSLIPLDAAERTELIEERKQSAGPNRGVKERRELPKTPVKEGKNGTATEPTLEETSRRLMA